MNDNITIEESSEKIAWTLKMPPRADLSLSPDAPLSSVIAILNVMRLQIRGEEYISLVKDLPGIILTPKD